MRSCNKSKNFGFTLIELLVVISIIGFLITSAAVQLNAARIVFGLEDKSNNFQSLDGVTACDGTVFHYGSGGDGIITIGGNCVTK